MVAKLISPQGEEFELTDEQFGWVKAELFPELGQSTLQHIEELCGKYADGSDMTGWYLSEKAKEREHEGRNYNRV